MRTINLLYIIFFICVCLFWSCYNGHEYPIVLTKIDSLTETKPDSAIRLLQGLDAKMRQEPENIRMYYRLLKIKAADKAYIPHQSADEICQIVTYYENEDDDEMLPWAYYYAGCVYRDLGDVEQSLDYYHKALASTDNIHIKGLCSVAIGYIFRDREMYDFAGQSFLASYQYDKMRNDTKGMIFDLRDIGRNYWDKREVDSAFIYLSEGLKLAKNTNDKEMISSLNLQLAVVYLQQDNKNKAKACLDACLSNIDSCEFLTYQSVLASYYEKSHNKDSASICYQKSFCSDNVYTQLKASTFLANYYAEQGKTLQSKYFFQKEDSLKNQVYKSKKPEKLVLKQYQYDKKKQHITYYRYLLIILLILLLIIVLYKKKNKFKNALHKKDLKKVSKILHSVRNNTSDNIEHLSKDEWTTLKKYVDNKYPNFNKVLLNNNEITENEYRVCLLIKLEIPVSTIGKILFLSTPAVSNIRKRLIEKVKGEKCSAKECDEWIKSL